MKIIISIVVIFLALISCEKQEEQGSIQGSWRVIDASMHTTQTFQTTAAYWFIEYPLFDDTTYVACLIASGNSFYEIDNIEKDYTVWTFDGIGEFFINGNYAGNYNGGNSGGRILTSGTNRSISIKYENGNAIITYPESYGMEDRAYPEILPDGTVLPRGRYTIRGYSVITFERTN